MTTVIQWLTHIVPARYFVAILHTLFLAGDIWAIILPNMAALTAMAIFFFALVWKKSRKNLE